MSTIVNERPVNMFPFPFFVSSFLSSLPFEFFLDFPFVRQAQNIHIHMSDPVYLVTRPQ